MAGSKTATALIPEVDRQLSDQRAQADAFATRSGLLIAATAVLGSILASVLPNSNSVPTALLWSMGGAAIAGVLVLCMSRVTGGPSTVQVTIWMNQQSSVETLLLQAKLLAIEANARALLRTEVVLLLQALATVSSLIMIALKLGD